MDLVHYTEQKCRVLSDILFLQAKMQPNECIAIWKQKNYTYQEIYRVASGLSMKIEEKVGRKKRVGLITSKSIDYLIGYFAIIMAGGQVVPFDQELTAEEISREMEYCNIELLIYNDYFKYKDIIQVAKSIYLTEVSYELYEKKSLNYKYNTSDINPDKVALFLHTSGSIDKPKRVMLTHRNIIENAKAHVIHMKLAPKDKVLITLPMHFGYCNTAQMIAHLLLGGTLIILDGIFSPHKLLNYIEKYRINVFTAVPTILSQVLAFKARDKYDLTSVKQITFGGAPIAVEKLEMLSELFKDAALCQTYGLTEAGPRVTGVIPQVNKKIDNSVGSALPNVKLIIIKEDGTKAKPFEIGEIHVKSPGIMKGYYERGEETLQVIKDGWLSTGDLGYVNNLGELFLNGRIKNIIIRGGINIYPEEIETYLMKYEKVKQIIVEGKPHEILGEVPNARVVVTDNSITTKDLERFARKGLAKYKIPSFEIVEELEYTYNKKIKRKTSK
ncbi:class I adenylate-forming enzyme family protein [Clostridium cibarium]|uniref:Acyl--CoA ligase n=1 Tax=Clostridium cibarium TaxID=2762247 RepID=A0ABR8PY10_9CLOT|nr:class I adenylate-forming enzyme family protein [Clostridium cibarium]MBD7913062.1 acyl--CoA ligase [Clostridium cibarium]